MMRIGGTIETPKTHISSFWMTKKGDSPLPPLEWRVWDHPGIERTALRPRIGNA
jgi:hypothetical protein